jgi:hypothetical protein
MDNSAQALAAALDRVSGSIGAHTSTLRADVSRFALAQRRVNVILAVFVALAVLGVFANYVVMDRIRQVQADGRENGRVIRDCTDPAGECYKRNQARLSGTVAMLNQAQLAIAKCAKITDTPAQLETCANAEIAKIIAAAQARRG